jgi:hypothetical protein
MVIKAHPITSFLLALATVGGSTLAYANERDQSHDVAQQVGVPESWLVRWNEPPNCDRPLQIVHGIDPRRAMPEGIEQMLHRAKPKGAKPQGMRFYLNRGLGGLVCNIAFPEYMRSEKHWKTLVAGVEQCHELGMLVWLYDEQGYPSGAAGGLVLEDEPQFEATELAYDPTRDEPFVVRPSYEYTHASNNYYAARRYTNLIDDRAVHCFIAKTHDAYWKRLEPYFGKTIQAMFTDEPSLIAVNIGQIPEQARQRVLVVDPVDPAARPLPRVPWTCDLPDRYEQRYGEDLLPCRQSLFVGDRAEDRKVRRQFWALVADLIAERYFGALQTWCGGHGIASSGHTLGEETLLHHVPLEGNGLKVLSRMDIPGLDMLSSNPETVIHNGWLTAGLPASAALLTGRRRVMTEVSDFSQKMGGAGPAALADMQATAAWQAAWGVTDFTLYYGLNDRSGETYRAYCDYVGRLNAVLKPARPTPQVLLYYPIYDLWSEYLPVAEPLKLDSQSPRARRIVASFLRTGRRLQRNQIPFSLIDHEHLAGATVQPDGILAIHDQRYTTLILPESTEMSSAAEAVVGEFRRHDGRVIVDRSETQQSLLEQLRPAYRITPPSERIALGQFFRDGRRILLAVNLGSQDYAGILTGQTLGSWHTMDPSTGTLGRCEKDGAGQIPLALAGRQAVLLVQTGASSE